MTNFSLEAISPDGKWAIGTSLMSSGRSGYALARLDQRSKWRELALGDFVEWDGLRWRRDGRALTYVRMQDGADNIWPETD